MGVDGSEPEALAAPNNITQSDVDDNAAKSAVSAVPSFTAEELSVMTETLFETCDGSNNGSVTELELGLLQNSGLHRFWCWMSETESIHEKKRLFACP